MEAAGDAWRGCGCKGIRSCLLCEPLGKSGATGAPKALYKKKTFLYNPIKGIAEAEEGYWFPFLGVHFVQDFVTEDEEQNMVHKMDQEEWKLSQSGRRKQDFGPKVNFKKQKIKVGNFTGLPNFSQVLWQRMIQHTVLKGFLPVEQCNLDYNSDRGASIDPHFDDSWLWGERLVSLNLLSDTVLTMTRDDAECLQLMPVYQEGSGPNKKSSFVNHANDINTVCSISTDSRSQPKLVPYSDVEVVIGLPRRSLVVLYGDARYKWKHAILRENIEHRRVCTTFRELSAEFSLGGNNEKLGQMLQDIAISFQGKSV